MAWAGHRERNRRGIYHTLNRGNAKSDIFFKEPDFEAFERLIAEGLCQLAWRRVTKELATGQCEDCLAESNESTPPRIAETIRFPFL